MCDKKYKLLKQPSFEEEFLDAHSEIINSIAIKEIMNLLTLAKELPNLCETGQIGKLYENIQQLTKQSMKIDITYLNAPSHQIIESLNGTWKDEEGHIIKIDGGIAVKISEISGLNAKQGYIMQKGSVFAVSTIIEFEILDNLHINVLAAYNAAYIGIYKKEVS